MQVIHNPDRSTWPSLLQRPYQNNPKVLDAVSSIMEMVRTKGDTALKELTLRFDGAAPGSCKVSEEELHAAAGIIPEGLKQALLRARQNIETFHRAQIPRLQKIATMPGVVCWQKQVPIDRVGLYVPGGTAPLFSTVLMLGVPAQLAGCPEVVLCTPCDKSGAVHPAVLYAASLTGIRQVYKVGGAQAIAAMAFGTETIPSVYKIFGPGNQYVTAAKQMVQQQGIAIDMPAGPSEVCVLADETARASFVAADLLAQAEHGPDSQVLLVTTDASLVDTVQKELQQQLSRLPRKETAVHALHHSKAVVVHNMGEAIEVVNQYAAEHLIICCAGASEIAERITNAGSVFIGDYSPESVGDYASGTNHTLPTNAFARSYSGVNMDSFYKKITFQQLSPEGLQLLAPTVVAMAEAEGLEAHAEAVRIRVRKMADGR